MSQFERSEMLVGKENMDKLKNAHVLVVGVGGVGGYATEMLARCGVGNITIVDDDVVAESNLNRQIIALNSTIGKRKVDVMKQRIFDINPACQVDAKFVRFNQNNIDKIFEKNIKFDFVIDAIDSLQDKALLISETKKRGIEIISALGTGNRIGIPDFKIADVFNTYNDGLARKFRKLLREQGVENLNVVFSAEKPLKTNGTVGSIVYSPAMCGAVLSAYVVNQIISKNISKK